MSNCKIWLRFSEEEDQKLIDLVRENPPIYQMKGRSYKNPVVKYGIWKLISQELGRNVDECKMRWKTIRDYYNRKKKKSGTSITASDDKRFNQLSFLDKVSRVDTLRSSNVNPFYELETRQEEEQEIVWDVITDDADIDEETEEIENSVSSETQEEEEIEQKAKRICSHPVEDNKLVVINDIKKEQTERTALLRELTKQLKDHQSSEDEWYDPALSMFFKSIAATVSTFSPLLKAKIKVEMMNLVSRYEIEHVTQSTATDSNEYLTYQGD